MSKEITKARILQEMQDKFGLREFEAAKFLFDETVVPVYNIEQHLREEWQMYVNRSVTTTGGLAFFTAPKDERWVLSRYDVVFMTGAFTISGVYATRPTGYRSPPDSYIYLDLKAAQNVSYHVELAQPIVLTPGSSLLINVDGYTSTGDLRLYIDYMMEKIR